MQRAIPDPSCRRARGCTAAARLEPLHLDFWRAVSSNSSNSTAESETEGLHVACGTAIGGELPYPAQACLRGRGKKNVLLKDLTQAFLCYPHPQQLRGNTKPASPHRSSGCTVSWHGRLAVADSLGLHRESRQCWCSVHSCHWVKRQSWASKLSASAEFRHLAGQPGKRKGHDHTGLRLIVGSST